MITSKLLVVTSFIPKVWSPVVTSNRQNIESCRPLLIEIKNAAQELLTRLEKYKPVNPLLSPGL